MVLAAIFAIVYQNSIAGLVFWLGAVSHWIPDLVVSRADLPFLWLGEHDRKLGTGLWDLPKRRLPSNTCLSLLVSS